MKKKILSCYCLLISVFFSHGQAVYPLAASYMGMNAYSNHKADIFSGILNPSSLSQINKLSIGVYSERRFLLSDLNNYLLSIALPVNAGSFALSVLYFGSVNYNSTQLGLGYGRKLNRKIDLGLQFNYNGIKITGYGKTSALGFAASTIIHINDRLHSGFCFSNIASGKYSGLQAGKLPAVFSVGWGYEASSVFFIGSEIVKQENQPVSVNAGMQYHFLPGLFVRAGVSSATSSICIGIGLMIKKTRLDVSSSYHSSLGATPGLGIIYNAENDRN